MVRAGARFFARAYDAPIDCFVITFPEPRFLPRTPRSGDGRIPAFIERARLRDDRPCGPGDLRCERDGDFVHVHPGLQRVEPSAETVARPVEVRHAGASAMDQELSHVTVSALADHAPDGTGGRRQLQRAAPSQRSARCRESSSSVGRDHRVRPALRSRALRWRSADQGVLRPRTARPACAALVVRDRWLRWRAHGADRGGRRRRLGEWQRRIPDRKRAPG